MISAYRYEHWVGRRWGDARTGSAEIHLSVPIFIWITNEDLEGWGWMNLICWGADTIREAVSDNWGVWIVAPLSASGGWANGLKRLVGRFGPKPSKLKQNFLIVRTVHLISCFCTNNTKPTHNREGTNVHPSLQCTKSVNESWCLLTANGQTLRQGIS